MSYNKIFQIFLIYITTTMSIIICAFVLNGRSDFKLLLTISIATILFFLSVSRARNLFDCIFNFLLPIAFTITKTVWIAHPLQKTLGILSVSAGLYICASDIIILYLLLRIPCFQSKYSIGKGLLIIYIIIAAISSASAYTLEFALAGILLYLKCFVIYEWFSSHPNLKQQIKYFIRGSEVALLFQGIIAILQKMFNGTIGLSFLGENNDALRYRIVNGTIDRGAAGTFEHSSKLAIFVIFVSFLILFNEKNKFKKWFLLIWASLILYLAASRTAIFIFLLAIVYNIWKTQSWTFKKNKLILTMILLFIGITCGIVVVNKGVLAFITDSDFVFQINNRLNHWQLALSYITQRWLLGYGLNNYASKMTTINSSNFYFLNPVHNNYLLNWFELGILGFILYIAIFIAYFLKVKRYKYASGLKKGALLFLICVVIYNLTGWAFASPTSIYLLWISFALIEQNKTEGD